jgi:hypothetical protein
VLPANVGPKFGPLPEDRRAAAFHIPGGLRHVEHGDMQLRICNGEFERIYQATSERLDEAFSPTTAAAPGTEITLSNDKLWLSATVLALTEAAVYLMSGGRGMGVIVMGRTGWEAARREFHKFLAKEPARAYG